MDCNPQGHKESGTIEATYHLCMPWDIGMAPTCLVPGSGVMRAGDSGLECEVLKRGIWGVDSGQVSLHLKNEP